MSSAAEGSFEELERRVPNGSGIGVAVTPRDRRRN
jgi:hypothetical protein